MDEFKQTMLRAFKEPDLLGTNVYPTIRLTTFGQEINGKKTALVFSIFRNSNKQPLLVFKTDTNALDNIIFDSTTFVLAETRFAFLQKNSARRQFMDEQ